MTNQPNGKPMSDDELEAVSGGITPHYADIAAAHNASSATTAQNATPVSADTINSIYGTGASHASTPASTDTSSSSSSVHMPTSTTPAKIPDSEYEAMGLRPPNQTISVNQNGVTGSTVYNIYD